MPLEMSSSTRGKTARLELAGELDGSSAPKVREEVERILLDKPDRLALSVEKLSFMASAGLRIIIFAKQRQPGLKIHIIRPQETVIETLKKTGFYDAVYIEQSELADEATAG
jgi:anti-anti-sigma factor